ncbi:hypothetical protein FRB90_011218 [Tulasnella sp. 427]|nr:hypothetical protein FRB90_011218 [Tulasnella sp. 427]
MEADGGGSGSQTPETPQLTDEEAQSIVVPNRPISYGGYAEVYKGTWTSPWTGKREAVAVKALRFVGNSTRGTEEERQWLDVMAKRLGREVFVWQMLHNHDRITPLLGYTRTANMIADSERPLIISPWREFGNLSEYIKDNEAVDRVSLLIQAAEAVNVLHTFKPKAIAHLDLKPENFLVTDTGEVELSDFGISRVIQDAPSGFTTNPGSGTKPYQAPEFMIEHTRSTAADVYAFGGVMLKALSGKAPFFGYTEGRLVRAKSDGEVPTRKNHEILLSHGVVSDLWNLMNKCWRYKPSKRPSMADVINEVGHGSSFTLGDED